MAGHYAQHTVALRSELGNSVPRDVLRALHRRSAARHFLVATRQFLVLGLTTWALVAWSHPLVVAPLMLVQGFTIFNFTVLLHEVLHHLVFARRRPRAERLLGLLYATPALFAIYFRAARLEMATYPPDLQRRSRWERLLSTGVHLAAPAILWAAAGWGAAVRAHLVPVFFVFPIAFTLNRLGQHYDINPSDPAQWSTLVRGSWFWDLVFLNSNYHLEHHYFPGVPFYHLPALQRALTPFYTRRQMRWHTFGGLVRGWLIENRAPHTNWAQ